MDIKSSKTKINQKLLEQNFIVIPFEEVLKNVEYENSVAEIKSSISKLQELLQSHNILPNFDLIESKEVFQQPIFKFRASFYHNGIEYFEIGSGNSKQEAKNASAKALLEKLNLTLFSFNQHYEENIEQHQELLQEKDDEEEEKEEEEQQQQQQQQDTRYKPLNAVNDIASLQAFTIYKDFIGKKENQIKQPSPEPQKTRNVNVALVKEISIEEAFRNLKLEDSYGNQFKTPVSKLQEYLVSNGMLAPIYELIPSSGVLNNLGFSYRVSLNNEKIHLSEIGIGRSKKEAKHAAAQALIDKLNSISTEIKKISSLATSLENFNFMPIKSNEITIINSLKRNDLEEENPIGTLQELCVAKFWSLPVYKLEKEFGPPHEKQFTITCTLRGQKVTAIGMNKKLAKRLAASKMLNMLKRN